MDKIKVFLVEDEIVIRSGIKKSIDWEKEGYLFVGEASDGELAYPMILKEKPDILITDIKMPFMDGLELSRLIKKELPDIKIVILSGYDEFDYARTAIRIGVTEYLLKPISSVKLLEVLSGISQAIRAEREEKLLLEKYTEEMKENTERDKMRLFDSLIMGEMTMREMLEEGNKYNMNLGAACYNLLLFKILSTSENYRCPEKMVEACNTIEEKIALIPYVNGFQRGVDGWAFLLTAEDAEQMREHIVWLKEELCRVMSRWQELEYFGGIGETVFRFRNLRQAFVGADKAFSGRFTLKSNQIISIGEMQTANRNEQLQMKGLVKVGQSREMIEKFLNSGTQEEVEAFSDAYIAQMEADSIRSTLVRQYVVMDMCMVIMAFCERLSVGEKSKLQKEAEELQSTIQKIHSMDEIRKYMIRLLKDAIELRDTISGRRYSDLIIAAQEIIAKTYMSEEISLNSVAVSVGMSPNYLSTLFSKETGKTFGEYLTEKRIEKAKELLMCSSKKMSQISFDVGYKDPHYFSYIFKKMQGCTPKEYRARRKE